MGLLEAERGGGFAYGRQTGAADRASSGEVPEPRFRWRLGLRAAVLVGALSLVAGAMLWWQVAANGPEVIPLRSVTHDAAGNPAASAPGPEGNDAEANNPESGGTESGGPDSDGKGAEGADTGGKDGAGTNGTGAAGNVVVHVAGAVKKTGVVRLPRGSRVHQAIAAAGGAAQEADLDRLNLASLLEDGQKIYVPRRGEAGPADTSGADDPGAEGSSGTASGGAGGKINLNTATVEQLDELPKVGPVLAQRIVDWRTQQGPFKSPEELDAVDGVGPKMLETLLPLVTV